MSTTVEEMLENRHTVYLEWVDPWPGLNHEKEEVTTCVLHKATVQDCLAIARQSAISQGHPIPEDEVDILLDFIAVMWAEPVE